MHIFTNIIKLFANRNIGLLFFLTYSFSIYSVNHNELDVKNIPDSLLENANAVIRSYKTDYKRISKDRFSETVELTITILNPSGVGAEDIALFYDSSSKLSKFSGQIYDEKGNEIDVINKNVLSDYAVNIYYTLYSDYRVKYFMPIIKNYPYTISYHYTKLYKDVLAFNIWLPNIGNNISVEHAELAFTTPFDLDISYKEMNLKSTLQVSHTEDIKKYHWQIYNIPALTKEKNCPYYLDYFPAIHLSPNSIMYKKSSGNFTSWKEFGDWSYSLIKDSDKLSDETINYIKRLTDTIQNPRDKIKAVYRYMQSKTRYVSISLGIGGFKPTSASSVDEKGYGDCKALSNYTKSLLNAISIESYYTIIGSGNNTQIKFPDFASVNQVNHVILCVPNNGDTIWLECTNQNIPFGYISTNNYDRLALLVKPEGGILVSTPKFSAQDNVRTSYMKWKFDNEYHATLDIASKFTGYLYEEIFGYIHQSKVQQKEAILRMSSIKGLEISKYLLQDNSCQNIEGILTLSGTATNIAIQSNNRILLKPNFFYESKLVSIANSRTCNLCQKISYTNIDTLNIAIPPNYVIESLPQNAYIESILGTYHLTFAVSESNIYIIRNLIIHEGNSCFVRWDTRAKY